MDKPTVNARRDEQPHDRLTRICDAMTDTFDQHREHRPADKCIVFLDDGTRGGIVIHGYDNDTDAMVDLIVHLKAVFEANGKQVDMMFLGPDGVDRA